MKRPDVETLVAYANDALTPEKARQIERFLEGNSEARRLIEDYRRMHALTRAAFEAPVREALPRHLMDAVMKSPRSTGVEGIASRSRMAGRPNRRIALTASLAIIAGLGFGAFLLGRDEESPMALGRLSTIDALSAALTRLVSGAPEMAGDRAITVLMTFRDAARRLCREFEISGTSPTAPRIVAIACLDDGAWRIEGAAWLMAGRSDSSGAFALASSEDPDPLAGLHKRLGAGVALAHEEEAALIARNWQEETGE